MKSEESFLLVKGANSFSENAGIVDLLSKSIGPSAQVLTLLDGHACHIVAKEKFIAQLQRFRVRAIAKGSSNQCNS